MNPAEPAPSNSLRYCAIGVVCVAMFLGAYFVRLNAQIDREREDAAERLALCQHIESVARAAATTGLDSPEVCKQLKKRYAESVAPL